MATQAEVIFLGPRSLVGKIRDHVVFCEEKKQTEKTGNFPAKREFESKQFFHGFRCYILSDIIGNSRWN